MSGVIAAAGVLLATSLSWAAGVLKIIGSIIKSLENFTVVRLGLL